MNSSVDNASLPLGGDFNHQNPMIGREKLVMKHARHASNPTGNEQSINITQPGTIQHNIIETSKTRSKPQNAGVNQPGN